jgi:hypothetical protein
MERNEAEGHLVQTEEPDENADEIESPPPLLAFLQTKEGHELASRVLSLFEGIQRATIESGAEQKKCEVQFQHSTTRLWLGLQAGAITIIIITAAALAWHGKLDATVATLMATLFGYFLGKTR